MAVTHAYTTFVEDNGNPALTASVGTISPAALADEGLATALRNGNYAAFLSGLTELPGQNGQTDLRVLPVNAPPSTLTPEEFARRVAAVLTANSVEEAADAWNSPLGPNDPRTQFAVSLLESTVLAEYSEARAQKAAGAVGAASATAAGGVLVAAITAGQLTGAAILIASPIGIVVVGAGAAFFTYRFVRGKRQKK
jgi:hypothetical protein